MRNKFTGKCYVCGETVEIGKGHFERYKNGWRVQHAGHAIQNHKSGLTGYFRNKIK